MSTRAAPRLLLIGEEPRSVATARLEAAGFSVSCASSKRLDFQDVVGSQVVLLDVPPSGVRGTQATCRRWRIELGETYVPIVVFPTPVVESHLFAQIRSLIRVHHLNQRLAARAGEAHQVNQRLQQAYQQMDQDLELTRRIHRGFLPQSTPAVGPLRFAIDYRPRSRIGGDFFDVMRLDENHVGVYLADAMGSGQPASSLLSIFVKKSLRPKEITGNSYRLFPPEEILAQLNRELLGLGLSDPPFVTMVWLGLDTRDGSLTFSRAAHPHPLSVPREGELEYWHSPGTLLGVFEADFPAQKKELRPGDKILLFSDGVNPSQGGTGVSGDALWEAATRHRELPIDAFVEQVGKDILPQSKSEEDFTLLGVEYLP
jgi:sigma-B regulation protein RsbU (phosphoserine phosphatase)